MGGGVSVKLVLDIHVLGPNNGAHIPLIQSLISCTYTCTPFIHSHTYHSIKMFLKQFVSVEMTTSLIIAVSSLTKQKIADLTLGKLPPQKLYIQKQKSPPLTNHKAVIYFKQRNDNFTCNRHFIKLTAPFELYVSKHP